MSLSGQNDFIKDSLVVRSILKELGIKDFEEQVINYLLGLNYKYSTTILEDAQNYSSYANKDNIDVDDVKLATQFAQDRLYIKSPLHENLIAVSKEINKIPLPPIKNTKGLFIPHDCAMTSDFKVKTKLDPKNDVGNASITTVTTAAEILEDTYRRKTKIINNGDLKLDSLIEFNLQDVLENQYNNESFREEIISTEELVQSFWYSNNSNQC